MFNKILGLMLGLVLMFSLLPVFSVSPVLATGPTTSVTITKYASDGTTIIDQTTVTWQWMEDNLPVQGDGITHYFHQGPTFDENNMWDPTEMVNIDSRDYGAVMGTDVKDLCDLVGGADAGDVIKISSPDQFNKSFGYEDVYNPEPQQGKMVVTWFTSGPDEGNDGYVPTYDYGMRLVFLAETTNPDGKLVFGDWDMHETLDEDYWHYYYGDGILWPSSSGLSVKWVSNIDIYSDNSGDIGDGNASLNATTNVFMDTVGISIDRNSIDYGTLMPGENSAVETVVVTNTGTLDCDVNIQVDGATSGAQEFYEQSLYVDGNLYNVNDIIAMILTEKSANVNTQVRVPSSWVEATGELEATFIFWATAH
jgi:hypothetical protein